MLIAFAGRKRSGKSTAAEHLVQEYDFHQLLFAEPVKDHAADIFGLTREQVYGLNGYDREKVLPQWGLSVRQILQRFGTEVGRSVHPEVWIRYLERALDAVGGTSCVIGDLRFPNEAAMVRRRGGYIVRVVRPNQGSNDDHASEAQIDDLPADIDLINDGTLEDFRDTLDEVYADLARRRRTYYTLRF